MLLHAERQDVTPWLHYILDGTQRIELLCGGVVYVLGPCQGCMHNYRGLLQSLLQHMLLM